MAGSPYRWDAPLMWFGVTQGCSLWIGLSGLMLLARDSRQEGLLTASFYLLTSATGSVLWLNRKRLSAYAAWQTWFAVLWLASLATVAVLHGSGTYSKVNLNEWGLLLMWIGAALGVPLLMLDTWAREKSDGKRNLFGAAFDLLAGFF